MQPTRQTMAAPRPGLPVHAAAAQGCAAPDCAPSGTRHTAPAVLSPARYFGRFPARPDSCAQYANLFGILLSLEFVQSEFVNGAIAEDVRDRLFQGLYGNFEAVRKALELNIEGVRLFARACNLPCALCTAAIEDSHALPVGASTAVELGTAFTTLSDLCSLRTGDSQYYLDLITKIRSCCAALAIHEDPEVQRYCKRWYGAFAALPPSSDPELALVQVLKREIQPWLSACQRVLTAR
jgi:hypothetical protein